MAVLRLCGVKRRYGKIAAVDGVDLETGRGEFLAILGPSGSGKTTLMRLVAGLEQPSAGDVLIDGRSVVGVPPRLRNVAMVFQSYAIYPHMSVRDNITFPLASRGVPAQRLKTISYGKERPVAVCDDISCWSQNRRAVTVLGGAGM